MAIDHQQRLWFHGDKISMYDPNSGIKSSFDAHYPIKLYAGYTQPTYKDTRGNIYFGGRGGFQSINPMKIDGSASSTPPKSVLIDFHLLNQGEENKDKHNIPSNILMVDNIDLRYDQNDFSIRFAAMDFHNPESNRYEFMLENHDEQWRPAGLEPNATYVKVPPGDYTFRVRGALLHSEWGQEKSVRIHISPPWWATWWAYSLYTFLAAGLLYSFYYFQVNRKLDKAEAYRLKELDMIKTRLYTNITHEFRTPLTVISGMAMQIKENPKEWFNDGLSMIQRNSNRLLELVNQMLDLSKLESGKMMLNYQQGDMIIYLKYLVESFHSFAESKNVQVHFYAEEDFLTMDYDPEIIQQVITNLLSNAVKFTPEGGQVYVSVQRQQLSLKSGGSQNPTNLLQITVRDTGMGIPEDQLPHIFDRFYQADDTTTRHSEGTGIGLALAKELMNLMGGEIRVKSKLGKGAEFHLLLPIQNKAPKIVAPQFENNSRSATIDEVALLNNNLSSKNIKAEASLNSTNPMVLLIEDNMDVAAYIAFCLQENYRIKVGKDGQEGIEIALKNIPDLIITDVMMPFKDGFEVCSTLKNDERTSHIPIIMLTAKADIESRLEGLEKGADAYLGKPFHKEELLIRIKKLLELRFNLQKHYRSMVGSITNEKLVKEIPEVGLAEDYFVQKAKKIVEAHLEDFDFKVEQFCKEIGMSHSQLHRKLTALTGLSAIKFIRYIRLNKAKTLLQKPDLTIAAVAFDTGFNDPSYFGRVFKKEFGVTPLEWKAMVNT